ncbi:hypothetical protein L7F22_038627 [Adiantum nelumboides]|nr:hypothetical protein [Adiantum nelumboides]
MHLRALARGRLSSQIHLFRTSRSRALHRQSEDLESLRQWLAQQHTHVDPQTFYRLLYSCGRLKALTEGKRIHALIKEMGLYSDVVMANCILNMYGKCHSVQDSRDIFDQIVNGNEVSWTSMIAVYAKNGLSRDAFDVFQRMQLAPSLCPNEVTFISVLIACNEASFISECNLIFTLIIFYEYECDVSVSNALVTAYTKCKSIKDAHEVFAKMVVKNVVSWTTMIRAFSELDDGKALEMYRRMLVEGVEANKVTHVILLSMCSNFHSLDEAKRFHVVINETGDILDVVLGSALVVTYGQCGTAKDAFRVFSLLQQRNLITWNGMISVFTHSGLKVQAFQHFEKMQQKGIEPDSVSFTTVLSQCRSLDDLTEGRIVHVCGVQLGIDFHETVGCALVEMYGKCGNISDAQAHFNRLEKQNPMLWSFVIVSHAKIGHIEKVLTLFCQMQAEGVLPNEVIFSSLLSALGEASLLAYGNMLHLQIRERMPEINDVIGSSLVRMYGWCGDLETMCKVFNSINDQKSVVMWNALMGARSHHGEWEECLEIFKLILINNVAPDSISFSCILAVCGDVGLCKQGERLYSFSVECEVEADITVNTAIVRMYGKFGRLKDALWAFRRAPVRGLIAWNSIISAYASHGHFEDILLFYKQMKGEEIKPNEITFTVMLEGCSNFKEGKIIHDLIVQNELEAMPVLCNALISTYGDCGTLQTAMNVFHRFSEKDLVSWNITIGLHARYLHFEEVFKLLHKVQHETVKLDEISLTHALSACTSLAASEEGKLIFAYAVDVGVHISAVVLSALVNMFSNCNQVKDAQNVFRMIHEHDVISCTAMIVAYVRCGQTKGALRVFQFMQEKRIEPSDICIISILSACSHSGLVDTGCNLFLSVINLYSLMPTLRHFCCLLDILSRSGQLGRAEDLLYRMPVQPECAMWITVIGACRTDCDIERGKQLACCSFELKPSDCAYSLLSSIYAIEGFPDNAAALSEELNLDVNIIEQQEESVLLCGAD